MLNADFFWRVFELTGSLVAYLMYRECKAKARME
ncbi:MAG: YqzL family protein [Bacillota bacterium]|nr:YqzL family protein [Bacillota bacterium]NLU55577.1 YqzL family protein [Bacillota bacterium]HOJ47034.1 YqzL family protein [Bacillota bacterium]HOL13860.1 YqzL family protein [Bacillota bacterium]HPQ10176.1 YqzL family protein [Bacillota bacterium]